MAQSDACLTGDQEIVGSVLAGSSKNCSFVEIAYKIFSMVILSLLLIQEWQLSVSGEIVHKYWLTT